MLSAILRPKRGRPRGERSPFSSPSNGLHSSPIAARRNSLEERRRPAADFNNEGSVLEDDRIDEEDEADNDEAGENQDNETNEDGREETTPLLPIFSAAHLGHPQLNLCAIFIRRLNKLQILYQYTT